MGLFAPSVRLSWCAHRGLPLDQGQSLGWGSQWSQSCLSSPLSETCRCPYGGAVDFAPSGNTTHWDQWNVPLVVASCHLKKVVSTRTYAHLETASPAMRSLIADLCGIMWTQAGHSYSEAICLAGCLRLWTKSPFYATRKEQRAFQKVGVIDTASQ